MIHSSYSAPPRAHTSQDTRCTPQPRSLTERISLFSIRRDAQVDFNTRAAADSNQLFWSALPRQRFSSVLSYLELGKRHPEGIIKRGCVEGFPLSLELSRTWKAAAEAPHSKDWWNGEIMARTRSVLMIPITQEARMRDWVFCTSSNEKVLEAERILGVHLIQQPIDLPEIQAIKLEDVISRKVELAYQKLGQTRVIVEDTGLFIDSWKGLPGALTRWFEETVGPAGICSMLNGFPERGACAQTIVASCDGSVRLFSGAIRGQIAEAPRGLNGFGWDTIFVPEDETRTFAEMSAAEKDHRSMRKLAFQKFANAFRTNL